MGLWDDFFIVFPSVRKVIIILLKACRQFTNTDKANDNSNFLCKLSKNVFIVERLREGYFIAQAGSCIESAWSWYFLFCLCFELKKRKIMERERILPSELHFFHPGAQPSLQVWNCYFNMTSSHVLHHLHHTPSTHPAKLSVDPTEEAVSGHLRNMCEHAVETFLNAKNNSAVYVHAWRFVIFFSFSKIMSREFIYLLKTKLKIKLFQVKETLQTAFNQRCVILLHIIPRLLLSWGLCTQIQSLAKYLFWCLFSAHARISLMILSMLSRSIQALLKPTHTWIYVKHFH